MRVRERMMIREKGTEDEGGKLEVWERMSYRR